MHPDFSPGEPEDGVQMRERKGVWVAFYSDFSEMVPFHEEVAALRFAVKDGGMQVLFVPVGVGIRETVHAHQKGQDVPSGVV